MASGWREAPWTRRRMASAWRHAIAREVNAIAAIVFNLNLKYMYHISHRGGGFAWTYGPSLNSARFL